MRKSAEGVRAIALAGPAGVGKTTLLGALAAAAVAGARRRGQGFEKRGLAHAGRPGQGDGPHSFC